MNKKEFIILRYICENPGMITQRIITESTGISLGVVNKIVKDLLKKGYINNEYQLTINGKEALEPYRVKSAIILAAGMSTRFIPVSYELPKGLISVKGEVMIEREIRQLQEAGIRKIIVVVGYMMEKFFYLRDKYHVLLVVNNEFSTKNTHSSVYAARDYLSNTYILCSDNYYPKNMFHQYEYRAYYCSVFLPGTSYVERAFTFNRDGLVTDTNKPSHDQWIMYGHAYFDQTFTDKFRPVLESYYGRPGVEGMYWENVWAENVADIPLWVHKCKPSDILEFDSMDDLKAFDPDYIFNNRIKLFENICNVLGCKINSLSEMTPIKKGLNNQSFKFCCNGKYYIYRHPGINASGVIDRNKEALALRAARDLGVDETFLYIDTNEGWKLSKYFDITDAFDFGNKKHSQMLAKKLKILHGANISVGFGFDYQKEGKRIISILRHMDPLAYRQALAEDQAMEPVFEFLARDQWQISLCHNDLYEPNLLVSGDKLQVIDWEFAGDADIGFDVCKLFAVTNPPFIEIDDWLEPYFGRKTTYEEKRHLIACAAVIYYYWYIWGIYAGKNSQDVSSYMMPWFDKMNSFRAQALEMINKTKA